MILKGNHLSGTDMFSGLATSDCQRSAMDSFFTSDAKILVYARLISDWEGPRKRRKKDTLRVIIAR